VWARSLPLWFNCFGGMKNAMDGCRFSFSEGILQSQRPNDTDMSCICALLCCMNQLCDCCEHRLAPVSTGQHRLQLRAPVSTGHVRVRVDPRETRSLALNGMTREQSLLEANLAQEQEEESPCTLSPLMACCLDRSWSSGIAFCASLDGASGGMMLQGSMPAPNASAALPKKLCF